MIRAEKLLAIENETKIINNQVMIARSEKPNTQKILEIVTGKQI